ncbi:BZ3500_MvSof-1268-A1-R1_Chr10-2g02992 [Microbotryum saponariae]|uniref:BZ3500_MvSof-1268-A1-R1_Chr10-2g02992 protein n=1 Tax=Microbotryum saponariae TaxID=289078 RepID=A0A2X0L8E8_9BASI|nr:BZ3501_MvSof-1269-A2-R1_Chr10-2g02578 [Microbotryum saponariae]SDA01889.1 BZ3500_MvSof-1268-A1-R1_Chr10-2g02992 [Microbotryum saponariae]
MSTSESSALKDELRERLVGPSKRSTGSDHHPSYGSFARDANMSNTMQVTSSKTDHAVELNGDPTHPSQSTTATPGGARLFMSKLTRRRRVQGEGDDGAGRSGGEHASKSSHWRLTHMLENKGSVARDHLANERTFLAWLRTSLSLASIGIAITQLFRLASTSVPTGTSTDTTGSSSIVSNSTQHLRSLLERAVVQSASSNESYIAASEELRIIRQLVLEQAQQILLLQGQTNGNPLKYRHLGKPIGGTFIGLALLFLLLGANRYFSVQSALMKEPKSMFPPSRRTVTVTSFCVAAIVIATFAAILAVR